VRHLPADVNHHGRQQPVTAYTISITPDDDSTTTRLRLDTSGEQVVLTDLHLHATDGLSTGQLPAIDYGLLLQAIVPTTPTPRSIAAAPSTPAAEGHAPDAAATDSVGQARKRTAAPKPASTATRGARRSASTPAPTAQPVASSRTRRASTVHKAAPAANKSARAAKKTAKATPTKVTSHATGGGGRAYRRMPEDFAAVYQQAGSATAAAEHYGVPRHTANGWIRRLRDQGVTPTSR
jgi:hypothetical protein